MRFIFVFNQMKRMVSRMLMKLTLSSSRSHNVLHSKKIFSSMYKTILISCDLYKLYTCWVDKLHFRTTETCKYCCSIAWSHLFQKRPVNRTVDKFLSVSSTQKLDITISVELAGLPVWWKWAVLQSKHSLYIKRGTQWQCFQITPNA